MMMIMMIILVTVKVTGALNLVKYQVQTEGSCKTLSRFIELLLLLIA